MELTKQLGQVESHIHANVFTFKQVKGVGGDKMAASYLMPWE